MTDSLLDCRGVSSRRSRRTLADVGPARRAVLNRITLDSGALW